MAQVSVTIDNRKYRLACNEGEEARLESLAGLIDDKIGELRASFGEIGDQRLVVMAALTVADSLQEALDANAAERARTKAVEARNEAFASSLDQLSSRLEALAAQLAGGAEAELAQAVAASMPARRSPTARLGARPTKSRPATAGDPPNPDDCSARAESPLRRRSMRVYTLVNENPMLLPGPARGRPQGDRALR